MATATTRRDRSRRTTVAESLLPSVFLYPGLLVMLALGLYPFLYILSLSLFRYYLPNPTSSRWVGLENFLTLFHDNNFWNSVSVTARFLLLAVGIEVPLGFGIALLLHSNRRFNTFKCTVILVPMILAPVVVGTLWKFMYNPQFGVVPYLASMLGIQSTFLGGQEAALWSVILADIWQWTPFVTLICLAGLSTLPVEPFEAAAVDGASPWQALRYITLPLMQPFLVIALVLRFITAYKVFDPIYIMTAGGPGTATQVLSMRIYNTAFVNLQIGDAAALSILMLILATLITKFVVQRLLQTPPDEDAALS